MVSKKVFVAGHLGMVGRALCRQLQLQPNIQLVTATRAELDLTDQLAVKTFFQQRKVDEMYLAAAKVGGIYANNTFPADFIYQNLIIECNLIQAAHQADVQKLLFLGSSCIYPKLAPQPIPESALLTGLLEPTNEPYAIAKIAGIKLCESFNRQYGRDYRCVMPTNLYGPYDNFHPQNSHVIPALIGKFYRAIKNNEPEVTIWGSGNARREFMHVDDLASACLHLMAIAQNKYWAGLEPMCSHINVGTGADCSIRELAELLKMITGFDGELLFDSSAAEGTLLKSLNVELLSILGWKASIDLTSGLREVWGWFSRQQSV
ncbi:GDP-L-fucose synthase family protein [Rheinheimera aquimaris]|uniref:GDP-L-fucose synthase family protein n=1 Tax=Rheinheimera aquimaris TaxID=412437 RepID=UPI001E42325D|nr:GDP-L-fucose synthase [Rheinheimera aquimaris]MCD1599740.1 GDP-L-fucose synthase [Rheinheimera aquimaris]